MELNKDAIRLIDRLYKDLYLSEQVLHHGSGNKYDKFNNIKEYINKLENIHVKISKSNRHIEHLKACYYDKYVIKREDIPESYYEHQKQISIENGLGKIELTEEYKKELQDEIIKNQKRSLDKWINFFMSDDANVYPFWAKYWAFKGMLNLGIFDKEKNTFYKRTKNTVHPFCDLNREALSMSIDLLIKGLKKETLEEKELELLIKSGSFQKIYTYILTKLLNNKDVIKRDIGKWVKYDQGSDHMLLVNSLEGYNTEWCTVGESTAEKQLRDGDFYVYYTLDENDEYKVPRVAIRMHCDLIAEIRGIAEDQHLEPEMEKVVEEKLKEFPDRDLYYKKINDMKLLTEIYNKWENGIELTRNDLEFLYEINDSIEGFGACTDERVFDIIFSRDKRKDLAYLFNCKEDQIGFEERDLISGDIIYYYSYLEMDLYHYPLPKYAGSDLVLKTLEEESEFNLPERVGRDLYIYRLKKIDKLKFPKYVGSLMMENLKYADELILPNYIRTDLNLRSLETIKSLELPEYVGGYVLLDSLKNIDKLILPKRVNSGINLSSLENLECLVFPEELTYLIHLKDITITPDNVDEYRNKKKLT